MVDVKQVADAADMIVNGYAKFFVKDNGDTLVQNCGILNDREIRKGLEEDARKKILDYMHPPLPEKPMNQKSSLHQMAREKQKSVQEQSADMERNRE